MAGNIIRRVVVTHPIIFPFSYYEEVETVRVFLSDETYRSVHITSSTIAQDVLFIICKALNLPFTLQWALCSLVLKDEVFFFFFFFFFPFHFADD